MNQIELKNLKEICAKLSDTQIHDVLSYSVEGLQAFHVLQEKGVQLGSEDTKEAFDTTAIRALYVAQEYAKRHGKDFKNVNEMIGQIQVKDADQSYRPESLSIEASMSDVLKTVMEAESIANKDTVTGSVSNRAETYHKGNIVIRPDSAKEAANILLKEEGKRFATTKAILAQAKMR